MPDGIRFDEVVLCEGAWYADMYLTKFGLEPGHKILIYGATGAIGTAAVLRHALKRFHESPPG